MHELALCDAIADKVRARAGGRQVTVVTLRVGHLRQVVPAALEFSWELLTEGTDLSGCELAVDYIPAVVRCRSCGERTELDMPVLSCEACGSVDVELETGEEFLVESLEMAA